MRWPAPKGSAAEHIGGTAHGYQGIFATLAAQQSRLWPNRTASPAAYLYIAALCERPQLPPTGSSRIAVMLPFRSVMHAARARRRWP